MMMGSPLAGRVEPALLLIAQLAYVYYLVLRLRKGVPRLLAMLPLAPLAHVVVWRVPTAAERVLCGMSLMWYLLFKLLLLAWDKGVTADSLSSFPRFLYANLSTLHLQQDPQFSRSVIEVLSSTKGIETPPQESADVAVEKKNSEKEGERVETAAEKPKNVLTLISRWVSIMATSEAFPVLIVRSFLFYICTIFILDMIRSGKDVMSTYVIDLLIGLYMYFFISVFCDGAVMMFACIAGTKVPSLMDMPFLSESLGEFWGRRWNLMIINLGRVSVYEPMLDSLSRGKKKPTLLDRAIATQTVFLVSGLMHELALFYATRTRASWMMTTFFLVNGVGTLAERFILKSTDTSKLPKFVRWAYTFTFLYFTGHWFFCPPIRTALLESIGDSNVLMGFKQ